MRLSTKFLLFNFLAKGIILLVFLAAGPFVLRYFAIKSTDRQLIEKRNEVLGIIEAEGIENFISEENPELGFGSYNILKEEYILLEQVPQAFESDLIFVEERILDNESVTYRVYSYAFEIDGENFLLEIGRSLQTIDEIEAIIFRILIGTVLLFFALSFFLDNAFNKSILRPFSQIIEKKLSHIKEPQQFSYKAIETNTEEFVLLDESLSEMMRRIQKAFNQERVFISHASHELKTPISVLQTKVENLFSQDGFSDEQMDKLMDMQQTIQKMKKTVNALLLISKVNNAQFIKNEEVPIHKVLEELIADWEAMALEKNIQLQFTGAENFVLKESNSSLCLMMIRNALVNAIKYTPESGKIILTGTWEGPHYRVSIQDNGPGISENLLKQVEDGTVFLKDVEKDKSGFGLQILYKVALYLRVKVEIKSGTSGTTVSFIF
ncbi:sensor histidine kinase [Cecembia rubra]|uniref:sensor histidine kinase n=1 Tax=Cecembia rubra TaxID=1485585 RepID=UPI002714E4E1|nr:HAMP domain-containing sensor histidine kinase [Cecembia rubra]